MNAIAAILFPNGSVGWSYWTGAPSWLYAWGNTVLATPEQVLLISDPEVWASDQARNPETDGRTASRTAGGKKQALPLRERKEVPAMSRDDPAIAPMPQLVRLEGWPRTDVVVLPVAPDAAGSQGGVAAVTKIDPVDVGLHLHGGRRLIVDVVDATEIRVVTVAGVDHAGFLPAGSEAAQQNCHETGYPRCLPHDPPSGVTRRGRERGPTVPDRHR